MTIDDAPRFRWRGLMLDSARHYQSPEFIEALHRLDGAAQAQRPALAPDRRPGLAPRDPQVPAADRGRRLARAGDGRRTHGSCAYGGYYTQDDVRDIVRHAAAAQRHDRAGDRRCPAMRRRAIAAYPALGVDGSDASRRCRRTGASTRTCSMSRTATFAFLEDVLREVMELFPGDYIHVGGDEAVKDQWQVVAARPGAHARARHRRRACAAELVHRSASAASSRQAGG